MSYDTCAPLLIETDTAPDGIKAVYFPRYPLQRGSYNYNLEDMGRYLHSSRSLLLHKNPQKRRFKWAKRLLIMAHGATIPSSELSISKIPKTQNFFKTLSSLKSETFTVPQDIKIGYWGDSYRYYATDGSDMPLTVMTAAPGAEWYFRNSQCPNSILKGDYVYRIDQHTALNGALLTLLYHHDINDNLLELLTHKSNLHLKLKDRVNEHEYARSAIVNDMWSQIFDHNHFLSVWNKDKPHLSVPLDAEYAHLIERNEWENATFKTIAQNSKAPPSIIRQISPISCDILTLCDSRSISLNDLCRWVVNYTTVNEILVIACRSMLGLNMVYRQSATQAIVVKWNKTFNHLPSVWPGSLPKRQHSDEDIYRTFKRNPRSIDLVTREVIGVHPSYHEAKKMIDYLNQPGFGFFSNSFEKRIATLWATEIDAKLK